MSLVGTIHVGASADSPGPGSRALEKYVESRYQLRIRFGSRRGSLELEATDLNTHKSCQAELIYGKEEIAEPKSIFAGSAANKPTEPRPTKLEIQTRERDGTGFSTSLPKQALDEALSSRNLRKVKLVLEKEYEDLATVDIPWLTETFALGYSMDDIAAVLLEEHEDCPWIPFESRDYTNDLPQSLLHMPNCVHRDFSPSIASPSSAPQSLDSDFIRRAIASICGLAGVSPDKRSKGDGVQDSVFPDSSTVRLSLASVKTTAFGRLPPIRRANELLETLHRIRIVVSSVARGLAYLQKLQVVCDGFTILCGSPGRRSVMLRTLDVRIVLEFYDTLVNASRYYTKPSAVKESADKAMTILNGLTDEDMPLLEEFRSPGREMPDERGNLHACAVAAQVLSIGLLLFCQAHMAPLHPFFLVNELEQLQLMGSFPPTESRPTICVESRKMSCLDGAFRSPLFVFIPGFNDPPVEDETGIWHYDMLADAKSLLETWGPGAIIRKQSPTSGNSITGVLLCGGVVHRTSSDAYHWSQYQSQRTLPRYDIEWDRDERMLIGAVLDVNAKCVQTTDLCLTRCHGLADPLSTATAFWTEKTREIGAQGGYNALVTLNIGFEKVQGRTLKAKYLRELLQGTEILAFLEAPCGLQVSFCSGLARRVTTRHLLLELMPAYVHRRFQAPAHWDKLCSQHKLLEVLANGDLEGLIRKLVVEDTECKTFFLMLAGGILEDLSDTGLRSSGDSFSVALVPVNARESIRRIDVDCRDSNDWTRVLRDTAYCATFAYFTPKCLQLNGCGCRNSERNWHRQVLLLQTEVHRHWGGHKAVEIAGDWNLKNGETYQLGRADADQPSKLRAKVLRPSPSEDPRLIVEPRTTPLSILRRLMNRPTRHNHLQERLNPSDEGVRVFMTSTECTTLSFAGTQTSP